MEVLFLAGGVYPGTHTYIIYIAQIVQIAQDASQLLLHFFPSRLVLRYGTPPSIPKKVLKFLVIQVFAVIYIEIMENSHQLPFEGEYSGRDLEKGKQFMRINGFIPIPVVVKKSRLAR